MQYQVLTEGRRLGRELDAGQFRGFAMSEKLDFDRARAVCWRTFAARWAVDIFAQQGGDHERRVARARQEYAAARARHFATDFTRQDAAVLNV